MAWQISLILASPNRPSRWTRTATETLSMESRLTTDRRGTGSSSGSRRTSLARPRTVVVHGATSARRCRGITAFRDRTTTGRRPISAISHHQTSPRAGTSLKKPRPLGAMMRGRPTHLVHRRGGRHRRCNWHQPRRIGDEPARLGELHQQGLRRWSPIGVGERSPGAPHRPWCSIVCDSCYKYATSGGRGAVMQVQGNVVIRVEPTNRLTDQAVTGPALRCVDEGQTSQAHVGWRSSGLKAHRAS
jgi:hypothetical protein